MNDTFNMNRFWLLVTRQWTENKKVYLLLWGVISLCIVVLTPFSENKDTGLIYFLLFCFGGCVMTTTLFSRWPDFGRSSFFLLLPASVTEKFLCGLFYGLILFIPVYCLNFLFVQYIITYLIFMLFPNNLVPFSSLIESAIREFTSTSIQFYMAALLLFLCTQSLYMISFIRFRKRPGFIFLLTLLAFVVFYNIEMRLVMSNIVHKPVGTFNDPGILLFFKTEFGYQGLSRNQPVSENFYFNNLIRNLNNLIWFVVFFILYLTAWYKLKEREL